MGGQKKLLFDMDDNLFNVWHVFFCYVSAIQSASSPIAIPNNWSLNGSYSDHFLPSGKLDDLGDISQDLGSDDVEGNVKLEAEDREEQQEEEECDVSSNYLLLTYLDNTSCCKIILEM